MHVSVFSYSISCQYLKCFLSHDQLACQSSPLSTCILSLSSTLTHCHINTLPHKEEFIRGPVVMKNIITEREMETDNERDCVCEESHIEGMYPVYVHVCTYKQVYVLVKLFVQQAVPLLNMILFAQVQIHSHSLLQSLKMRYK